MLLSSGWSFAWVSWFAVLERAEPASCRVRIQPRAPEAREDWETRLEVYRDLGWAYAAQMNDYEVYYCDDPAAAELESDPVAQKWAWDKSLKSAWRQGWLELFLFAALAVFLLYHCISQETTVEWFLRKGPELVLVWLLCAVGIFSGVRKLLSISGIRHLLDAGVAHAVAGVVAVFSPEQRGQGHQPFAEDTKNGTSLVCRSLHPCRHLLPVFLIFLTTPSCTVP